jgi:hypothetical protein
MVYNENTIGVNYTVYFPRNQHPGLLDPGNLNGMRPLSGPYRSVDTRQTPGEVDFDTIGFPLQIRGMPKDEMLSLSGDSLNWPGFGVWRGGSPGDSTLFVAQW